MMGKTHIAVGIAASTALLTFAPDYSDYPITAALIGGVAGGIYSDVDVESNDYCKDAIHARIIAGVIIAGAFLIDWFMSLGVCGYIESQNRTLCIIGIVIFIIACLIGALLKGHRGFTHSLLAMLMTGVGIGLFCLPILPFYLAGFISHILLDLFNKKNVEVFFPLGNGFCFHLCYAKGPVNVAFLILGVGLSILFIGAHLFGFDPTTFTN